MELNVRVIEITILGIQLRVGEEVIQLFKNNWNDLQIEEGIQLFKNSRQKDIRKVIRLLKKCREEC